MMLSVYIETIFDCMFAVQRGGCGILPLLFTLFQTILVCLILFET